MMTQTLTTDPRALASEIMQLRFALQRMCDTFSDAEAALIQQPAKFWRTIGRLETFSILCVDASLVDHVWGFAKFLGRPQDFRYHVGCREALAEVLCRLEQIKGATVERAVDSNDR